MPAGLCPAAGWGPHRRLRAGGHGGRPDAPQRPADGSARPPAPIRALDCCQRGTARRGDDTPDGGGTRHRGTAGTPLTSPISPQKHTDDLQAQAEASLLGLICRLYQVGRGAGESRRGWGTTPCPCQGSTSCSLAGGEAQSLRGLRGPEGPIRLQALRDGVGAPSEQQIKRMVSWKDKRLRVGGGEGAALPRRGAAASVGVMAAAYTSVRVMAAASASIGVMADTGSGRCPGGGRTPSSACRWRKRAAVSGAGPGLGRWEHGGGDWWGRAGTGG